MKKSFIVLAIILILQSCLPVRIAPSIEDYKITKGKKFKRVLPKRQMFIFQDSKDANEFYNYVNTKFHLNDKGVYDDVPFILNKTQFFFSFYEVDIPNKSINLIPIAIDLALEKNNIDSMLDEIHTSRKGNWYIAIEVYNDEENDCLANNSTSKNMVSTYLKTMKDEYLATYNYNTVLFKK